MSATHYGSFEDFNADVEKAREAYAADRLVERGLCATCGGKREPDRRRCRTCCWESRKGGDAA